MVIDTSAVLAILLMESDAERYAEAIGRHPTRLMSALSMLEASIVLHARKGPAAVREFDLLVHHARIEIVALTAEQAETARDAWKKYARATTLPDSILVIVAVMRYREFPVSLCCSRDRISPRPTYSSARSRDSGSSLLLRPRMGGVV